MARFPPVLLPWYFVAGRMPFTTEVRSWASTAKAYARRGRRVEVQQLDLTEAEARDLRARVEAEAQHRDYDYHYFFDNCATRPRDHLDAVVGGRVRAATSQVNRPSYRALVRSATAPQPLVGGALDVVLGRPAEVALTRWEAMFLPAELQAGLAEVRLQGPGGEEVPLVARMWTDSSGAVPTTPGGATPGLAPTVMGLVWSGLLLGAARLRPWLFRLFAAPWCLLAGGIGLVLLAAWFTDHPTWRWNENLLLFGPWSLALGALLLFQPTSAWFPRLAVATAAVAALETLAGLVDPEAQANLAWSTLALPVHVTVAWVALRVGMIGSGRPSPAGRPRR
ncbi:MAG: DUF4105 domain-containing protein [Deltaproteobacteria bacterium]|nr:DUF4105 domain-containing protein [Deltaproteobacteria bacterium]